MALLIVTLALIVLLIAAAFVRREVQIYCAAHGWNPSGTARPTAEEMKPMGFCDGSTGRAQRQLATPATD